MILTSGFPERRKLAARMARDGRYGRVSVPKLDGYDVLVLE
jgi:hypothetical protein